MTNPFNLTGLGISLLVAVVLGIQLGSSAIGEIKPVYFQGPPVHPRDRGAAIDESQLSQSPEPTYADLYGWDEGGGARAADCGDCAALRARDAYAYSAVVPYFGPVRSRSVRVDPEPMVEEAVVVHRGEAMGGPIEPVSGKPDVSRYTNYPLTYEEAAFVPGQGRQGGQGTQVDHSDPVVASADDGDQD